MILTNDNDEQKDSFSLLYHASPNTLWKSTSNILNLT